MSFQRGYSQCQLSLSFGRTLLCSAWYCRPISTRKSWALMEIQTFSLVLNCASLPLHPHQLTKMTFFYSHLWENTCLTKFKMFHAWSREYFGRDSESPLSIPACDIEVAVLLSSWWNGLDADIQEVEIHWKTKIIIVWYHFSTALQKPTGQYK